MDFGPNAKSWKSHYRFVVVQFLIPDKGPLQQYSSSNATVFLLHFRTCPESFCGGTLNTIIELWNDFCRNIRKCCYTTSFSVWLNASCCVSPYFSFDHHHQSFHCWVEVVGCHLKDCVKLVKGVCVGVYLSVFVPYLSSCIVQMDLAD